MLKVGDEVVLVKPSDSVFNPTHEMIMGAVGRIINRDHSNLPYKVQFDGQRNAWCTEDMICLADQTERVRACLAKFAAYAPPLELEDGKSYYFQGGGNLSFVIQKEKHSPLFHAPGTHRWWHKDGTPYFGRPLADTHNTRLVKLAE